MAEAFFLVCVLVNLHRLIASLCLCLRICKGVSAQISVPSTRLPDAYVGRFIDRRFCVTLVPFLRIRLYRYYCATDICHL